MRYLYIVVAALAASSRLTAQGPRVAELTSPCVCVGCHGSYRAAAKTDTGQPPASIPSDHQLTPRDVAAWAGPGGVIHADDARTGKELEWFSVTGLVTAVRVEADADLHLQLAEPVAQAGKSVELIVEIPDGPTWCAIRRQVLGWTSATLPLHVRTGATLRLRDGPVIQVVGHAFYDAEHAVNANTQLNRRSSYGGTTTAIWEIHPVMALQLAKPTER